MIPFSRDRSHNPSQMLRTVSEKLPHPFTGTDGVFVCRKATTVFPAGGEKMLNKCFPLWYTYDGVLSECVPGSGFPDPGITLSYL